MDEGLSRFVDAQSGVYETVLQELHDGEKRTHWMWFVFPQLRGLGRSGMAHRYGIADLGDDTGDLVADDDRVGDLAPLRAHGVDVGVADARELRVDEHLVLPDVPPLDRRALQRSVGRGGGDGLSRRQSRARHCGRTQS